MSENPKVIRFTPGTSRGASSKREERPANAPPRRVNSETPARNAASNANPMPAAEAVVEELFAAAMASPAPANVTPVNTPAIPPQTCVCGRVVTADAKFCHACGARVSSPEPRYRLVGVSPESRHVALTLDAARELTIGTAPECSLAVAQDDYVSRRHARLVASDGMLFVEDLGSTNGTFIRVRRPTALDVGDEIVVGTSVFRLENAEEPPEGQEEDRAPDR